MPKKKKTDPKGYVLSGLLGSLLGVLTTVVSLKFLPQLLGKISGKKKK